MPQEFPLVSCSEQLRFEYNRFVMRGALQKAINLFVVFIIIIICAAVVAATAIHEMLFSRNEFFGAVIFAFFN